MNVQVESLKKQQENAVLHGQITHGQAKKSNPLARIDAMLEYVRENRKALNACTVTPAEAAALDGGKYSVDVRVTFHQMAWDAAKNQGNMTEHTLTLPVEVNQVDGQWLVTSEPPQMPSEGLLGLIAAPAREQMPQ